MNEESVNAPAAESAGIAEQLAKFGVPKSKRGARLHVVLSAPSKPHEPQCGLPDEWRAQNACTMTMDRALREMEFPSRLAGAEWVLE